jgi:phosphoribosylformylglycinamidine synthase
MSLWRFEVSSRQELPDPHGSSIAKKLADFGLAQKRQVRSAKLYVIDLPPNLRTPEIVNRIASDLLADPVAEVCRFHTEGQTVPEPAGSQAFEVHLRPGVMDNVAQSTTLALKDMGIEASHVRTARRYEIAPKPVTSSHTRICELLGNDCIEEVFVGTRPIVAAPTPPEHSFELRRVAMRNCDRGGLERLSRDGHLFLSIDEMLAVQSHYRDLGRDPTDLELETLAQTWSEHCVHKTLKSSVTYLGDPMPGSAARELKFDNLLRDTIARATKELMAEGRGPKCLSVFKDNAGIIAFDDETAVAFKVETHNHPSAIEPYGGSATGVGGVIRDVLGCGLGAKPIANTDVFCVAPPDWPIDGVPSGVIHPRTVLEGVVAGVRDYGNCMGIPTVNGAIHFDRRYLGNPLVYCGSVGVLPRDRIEKASRPGDLIVLLGGRTGRDGIHGATFSSVELTDTHEDEFAHAVQIGNPIEEKKVLDIVLQARDHIDDKGTRRCLFSAITDCGAGGLSSAIGEMAADCGCEVDLDRVPLKYAGLRYDEIWISEAQERMVLAVPPADRDTFLKLCASESVEATVIGKFTDTRRLVVRYRGETVGDLDLHFLHEGIPRTTRNAEWSAPDNPPKREPSRSNDIIAELKSRLNKPGTASKHWLIHQYDHQVQARTVVGPTVGKFEGPSDAAVIRPRLDSTAGIAIGCGMATHLADIDPYHMAIAAIDEAIRNIVCVGGDPTRTAILDNFCWPRVDNPRHMGALVRACQACYDAAKAYGVPFISGKDSLNNEFALDPRDIAMLERASGDDWLKSGRIAIAYTLLISAISLIDDVRKCVTSALRDSPSRLYLVVAPGKFEMSAAVRVHRAVASMIREGIAIAAHDVSDGGVLVTIAEMCIATGCSAQLGGDPDHGEVPSDLLFNESPAMYVLQIPDNQRSAFEKIAAPVSHQLVGRSPGRPCDNATLTIHPSDGSKVTVPIGDLSASWREPLDW